MKKHIFFTTFILTCFAINIYGQTGNTRSNPIVAGVFSESFSYSNSQNTINFTNNYTGRSTNDVYYLFSLTQKMEVTIKHCGSTVFDTYLYLLDLSGNLIDSNDEYYGDGKCSNGSHSYLKKELNAGTYYVVSEGYSQNGVILTQISGTPVYVQGDSSQDPVNAGTYSTGFQYSNTQNTAKFTNRHTNRSPNDVFYKFTLSKKMLVTVTHCGSDIDTYMFLLDASGNTLAHNDDYSGDGACSSTLHSFIQKTLEAGVYYVVSEGYGSSGLVTTNITGYVPEDLDYPDIPDTYSSDTETVGSVGGSFNVSATGGTVYSFPVEVPQGVGGLQPSLSIVYNSQAGNGVAGWGINISGISAITRGPKDIYHDGTAKPMTYLADEAYYLDGQRLIHSSGTAGQEGAVYYPESDPFTKVTVHGTCNTITANTWFEVLSSGGIKYYYGNTTSGRQSYTASGGSPRINAWYLDYVEDPLGNKMTYSYNKWDYFMYPGTITYGSNKNESGGVSNTISFDYESRSDVTPSVIEGIKGQMYYRLKTITAKTGNNTYRSYELQYNTADDGTATKFSRLTSVTEKNGAGEALKPTILNWAFLPSFSQTYATPTVGSTYVPLGVYGNNVAHTDQSYISADLNGDGIVDLIGIFPYKAYSYYANSNNNTFNPTNIAYINWGSLDAYGNVKYTSGNYIDLGATFQINDWKVQMKGTSPIDFDGDGINELLIPTIEIIDNKKNVRFKFISGVNGTLNNKYFGGALQHSSEMPVYDTGDMNNDGKGDIIFMEKGHSSNKYPCMIIGHNQGTSLYNGTFNLTLPSKPEKMFVSDFNGNGLQDIMVFYSGGYTIFWNQGNGINNSTLSDSKKTTGTNIGNVWRIWPGDFNGDGLQDFLMSATGDNKWYFALNNGNGTFTKQLACTLEIYDQNFTGKDDDKFNCHIYDFDYDGKSDVVITKSMYTKKQDKILGIPIGSPWGEFNKTYTYWMRSTGSALTQVSAATSNREEDAKSMLSLPGDFNGDGQVELMNYGYNCYSSTNADNAPVWQLYRNSSFSVDKGKVTSVTDGYGSTTSIQYASLVNGGIYTKGTGSTYPVNDCTLPVHAVKTVTAGNGAAGNMITNYQYGGLKLHLQGKGLLGMTSVKADNTTLGTVTEQGVKSWNTSFYIPAETYAKTTADGKTAETNTALKIVDKGSKKYFAYPLTKTEKDLDGNIVTTTCKFNETYGYIEEEKADFGAGMYKTVQYGNYISAGNAYKPRLITKIQKHADDNATFTQKTAVTYDTSKGYIKQTIENEGSSLPLTTDYTYDAWGNVLTSKASGSGITPLTRNYEYDASKRFVAKAYTSPSSSVSGFTYDTWGNVLTEKDETNASNVLTTTHTYDNWGNRTSTVLPDGEKTIYRSGWNSSTGKRFFTLAMAKGRPWIKTFYDNRGREVLMKTIGFQGMAIQKTKNYNDKGQLLKETVQTGNLTTTENYAYDNLGRIKTQSSSSGQSVEYIYDNRKVSTVTDGKTYVKTFDAWGNIKTSADTVSSISYTYKSFGKPQKITTGGAAISMTYYDTGMQNTLTDPAAGTITYTYDAAGRVKTLQNGRGKTMTRLYDVLGRDSVSTTDSIATKYTYGTSGNDILRLTKAETDNNSIAYSYDTYGRAVSETRVIDGTKTLSFEYTYNTLGQVSRITYPGSLQVNRQYDAYGNLQKVLAGTQPVWELTEATGTVTTTQLGGTLTATETRNAQGLLTGLKTVKGTAVLHNMGYVFNGATGNLTSRSGMIGQTESFLYDNMERLTTVKEGSTTVMSVNYQPGGNILNKTGLGEYHYTALNNPYLLRYVDNTGDVISENDQAINYTAFNKVSGISETTGSDAYVLDIIYGPDRQRWKSTLKKNNAVTRTIIYADDFESITENGVTRDLYYIPGGNGLAALYVKQSGQTDKIYYAHKDHLGSIVKLTDGNGTEVFKAAYDAWGNRTVINNTFAFHRGYTGHEHLTEFRLIDMNGRMYDPLLGRFLSPDPYVQMLDFSQSFNRYAYCLNNPLRYTDPDGEFWHIVIGAVVGGVINLSIKAYQGKINSWGDGFAAFGIGAAAGAIGAATGGAAFAAAGGAAGGAGGFLAGAAGGAVGTAVSSPVLSMGNTAYFGDPMMTGKQYLLGIAGGALLGGGINGITALANGRSFWNGNLPSSTTPIMPTISQPAPNQQSNNTQPNQSTTSNSASTTNSTQAQSIPTNAELPAYQVTPEGVVIPKDIKYQIPGNLIESPYDIPNSSSYGVDINGKYNELLRIDAGTLPGYKGPNFSHYHLFRTGTHYVPTSNDPGFITIFKINF